MSLNPELRKMLNENTQAACPALQDMPLEDARAALRQSFIQ